MVKVAKKGTSTYKVQNIVATASLGKPVPLTKLARTQPNTEYNPETFPGLVLRVKEPKSAVLVFSSGNLVCTGTKSISQVKQVIEAVIKQLRKINVNITKAKITQISIDFSEKGDPEIYANLALYTENNKQISTFTIGTKPWNQTRVEFPPNIHAHFAKIKDIIEVVAIRECNSSLNLLEAPKN